MRTSRSDVAGTPAQPTPGDITVFVRGHDSAVWAINYWGGA